MVSGKLETKGKMILAGYSRQLEHFREGKYNEPIELPSSNHPAPKSRQRRVVRVAPPGKPMRQSSIQAPGELVQKMRCKGETVFEKDADLKDHVKAFNINSRVTDSAYRYVNSLTNTSNSISVTPKDRILYATSFDSVRRTDFRNSWSQGDTTPRILAVSHSARALDERMRNYAHGHSGSQSAREIVHASVMQVVSARDCSASHAHRHSGSHTARTTPQNRIQGQYPFEQRAANNDDLQARSGFGMDVRRVGGWGTRPATTVRSTLTFRRSFVRTHEHTHSCTRSGTNLSRVGVGESSLPPR